jgi:hypothetical protein
MLEVHDQRPVVKRLHAMNHCQRKDEGEDADGADADQNNVDSAVQALATPAMVAHFKMSFVVDTHVRGNS